MLGLAFTSGARRALWLGWLPAMLLLPVWMIMEVGSLTLDLRTVAGVAAVIGFLLAKDPKDKIAWNGCDLLIVGIIMVQAVSQYHADSMRPFTMLEIGRKWLIPYLMGRWFLGSLDDIPTVLKIFAPILLILTGLTVFECFVKINPINTALGMRFGLLEEGEGYRWGMKRAHVTFNHPIFFGMMLVMMLPWAFEASRLCRQGGYPKWWGWMPRLLALCLFCCVSRGPQLAGMFTAATYYFFRLPKIRMPVVLLLGIVGPIGYLNKDVIVELLGKAAGEKQEDIKLIMINGEEYEYTGTAHRMLLFKVYDEPIQNVGFFGYGTQLKGVTIDESLEQTFGSIDCHYLLFMLWHGYLGVGAFCILTLTILLKLGRLAFQIEKPQSALAAGLLGAMFGVAILLVSVWFSSDFAGVWLFSAGLASGLQSLVSNEVKPAPDEEPTLQNQLETPARSRRFLTPIRPPQPEEHHASQRNSPHPDHQPR